MRDCLAVFEVLLAEMRRGSEVAAGIARLRREVGNLRRLFTGSTERGLDLLLQRFSNYLGLLSVPEAHHLDDLAVFLDLLTASLDREIDPPNDEAEFVRSLPVMRPADIEDFTCRELEVLLVDPQRTSARFVARELQNCGYRVVLAARSYEALEIAVRTVPDMVISAFVLDELDGIELVSMLRLARTTAKIPLALITSFGPEHADFRRLPEGVALIGKGATFSEDLVTALARFGLA